MDVKFVIHRSIRNQVGCLGLKAGRLQQDSQGHLPVKASLCGAWRNQGAVGTIQPIRQHDFGRCSPTQARQMLEEAACFA